MGSMYARMLRESARAELVAYLDPDPAAKERALDEAQFTSSPADLFAIEFDLLLVCTPEHLHRELVVAGLARGLTVFCEKPLAHTLVDARAMLDAADRADGTLLVGHTLRMDPRYAIVQSRVSAGELGTTLHVVTRRNNPVSFGRHLASRTTLPLYLSIHDLDAMQWIVGAPIVRVYAEGVSRGCTGAATIDAITATMRFADGSIGLHETTWALPEEAGFGAGDFLFSIVGTAGAAHIEIREQNLAIYGGLRNGPLIADAKAGRGRTGPGLVEYPDTTYGTTVLGVTAGVYAAELEHVVRVAASRDAPILMSPSEAYSALEATLALQRSLTEQRPVEVSELQT